LAQSETKRAENVVNLKNRQERQQLRLGHPAPSFGGSNRGIRETGESESESESDGSRRQSSKPQAPAKG